MSIMACIILILVIIIIYLSFKKKSIIKSESEINVIHNNSKSKDNKKNIFENSSDDSEGEDIKILVRESTETSEQATRDLHENMEVDTANGKRNNIYHNNYKPIFFQKFYRPQQINAELVELYSKKEINTKPK